MDVTVALTMKEVQDAIAYWLLNTKNIPVGSPASTTFMSYGTTPVNSMTAITKVTEADFAKAAAANLKLEVKKSSEVNVVKAGRQLDVS